MPKILSKTDPLVRGGANCPFCGFPFHPDDNVVLCPSDHTPHHAACWAQNGNHCTTLGCAGSGEITVPTVLAVAPSGTSFTAFLAGVAMTLCGVLLIGTLFLGYQEVSRQQATATARAQATGTAYAQVTATAQAQATATAQARATAAMRATLDARSPKTFEVRATMGWQDTGMYLQQGENVEIKYQSGRWSASGDFLFGAEGRDWEPLDWPDNVLKGYRHGSLIGKVGDGTPFYVGAGVVVKADRPGNLFLRINDARISDNSGSLIVSIRVPTSGMPATVALGATGTSILSNPFSGFSFGREGVDNVQCVVIESTSTVSKKSLSADKWFYFASAFAPSALGSDLYWTVSYPNGQKAFEREERTLELEDNRLCFWQGFSIGTNPPVGDYVLEVEYNSRVIYRKTFRLTEP